VVVDYQDGKIVFNDGSKRKKKKELEKVETT